MIQKVIVFGVLCLVVLASVIYAQHKSGDDALGIYKYDDFQKGKSCGTSCHVDIYRQWEQEMHSQAYSHHWDEIEYFELAVPHAEKDEVVAGVKAGCNGCHTPIAFMAGDVPPPRPAEGSMANEAVNCDVCHTVTGIEGDVPFNFNFISEPGFTKQGPRGGVTSPEHEIHVNEFLGTAEFCGSCHNEKSPYGVWVKSTHLEWQEGPYSKEGVQCHECHMPRGEGRRASMGKRYPDVRQHLFHGAHDPMKVSGTVELRIHSDIVEAEPGEKVVFTVVAFNQKAGHMFPTGSVEDRIVWMHVEAEDASGKVYHLPVDKKGFEGEEYTIATDELAYQDMAVPLNDPGFKGVERDGVPVGDRIFRKAYFDPQGRMTIMQWNTKSQGADYRIPPRGTKVETYTFNLPYEVAPGEMKVTARIYYSRLVEPVARLLNVPEEEFEPILVGQHHATVTVYD